MLKNYMIIAHYTNSTATILALNWIDQAYYHFSEVKLHPELCFAILYAKSQTGAGYRVLDSYVNADQRNAYEFTLLGFDR